MKTLRILVVDSDPDVCEMLTTLFESEGYDVSCALSADEARRKLADHRPDIALIDLMTRGESGLSLAAHAASLAVHVVLMTGAIDREREIRAARWPVIRKPFRHSELLGLIDSAA
jgi:DNA-binding response OmpR family regulator